MIMHTSACTSTSTSTCTRTRTRQPLEETHAALRLAGSGMAKLIRWKPTRIGPWEWRRPMFRLTDRPPPAVLLLAHCRSKPSWRLSNGQ